MRPLRLVLATLLLASCNSILGNKDLYLVKADGGAGADADSGVATGTAGAPSAGAPAAGAPSVGAGGAATAGASGASGGAGGSTAGAGGSTAGTGGSTAGTGGSTAGTGGSTAGTGGSTAGAGGSNAGAGGAAGAPSAACTSFCTEEGTVCMFTGGNAAYASNDACIAACRDFTPGTGVTGNTLACRQYHLDNAKNTSTSVHCPHTAKFSHLATSAATATDGPCN